ncbi:hypothetical protein JIN85_16140 [Luteolibacter pohnpeiensis]|uniref:Uncharacterized protein n=1 Tax=Luteolibacter pohnpeiensis TaxID=454153 RepID=A0A934S9Q1_9BACT|nr:hypothetical protein [Luteolibacter pohnpeiensis]MBK1883950.1 hypothetical protein [Luteolibacter pohnpeiensis]
MKQLICSMLLCLIAMPAAHSQTEVLTTDFINLGTQGKFIHWESETGYTYFLQSSDPADPLRHWIWAPIMEQGYGQEISHEVDGTASKGFFRLIYTNRTPADGETLESDDYDEDGLSNWTEISSSPQTSPVDWDTDGDGMDDGFEVVYGLDPTDDGSVNVQNGALGDLDGDGVTNYDEYENWTSPADSGDYPFELHFIRRQALQQYTTDPDHNVGSSYINFVSYWSGGNSHSTNLETSPISAPGMATELASNLPFPDALPTVGVSMVDQTNTVIGGFGLGYYTQYQQPGSNSTTHNLTIAELSQYRVWMKRPSSQTEGALTKNYLFITQQITNAASPAGITTNPDPMEVVKVDPITFDFAAGQDTSAPADLLAQCEAGAMGTQVLRQYYLLPVEVAPEVLAVNSDFDEGKIDPATGYAIPDCDDVPGVDPKTGAGNTLIGLNAVRDHLDNGAIKAHKLTTDDLHRGWFGVNPQQLGDHFWDGTTVTIRKVDQVDLDTGRKESGQVRFYAKWGNNNADYYGIVPYNLETLAPNNLVTSGVNGKPGEGVYGSTSTIPDDAEFWMEGVRPGKITLEWRLQKGDIDVKHEQTFLVETRKSSQEWKNDLAYKIRLDTENDPSGQIDVSVDPRGAPREYWTRVERMSEYYDYYQENYLADDDFQWCGLARLAGSQVISGVSDARFATLSPSAHTYRIVGEIIDAMSEGGYDIFNSLAWQHHAYRSSGLVALEWTNDNYQDQDLVTLIESWRELEDGIREDNEDVVAAAARRMTIYEQQQIIVPTWNKLRAITPVNNEVTNTFTILAENVMKPDGERFTVAVPTGDLSDTDDRWKWIDDTAAGTPNGIIGAWKAAGRAGQRALVSKTLRVDSERFTQVPAALRATAGVFPGGRSGMQVNDDLDTP